jgi:MarR family transcriptional regulator, exopolysaccharide II synthesis transcriptional activator
MAANSNRMDPMTSAPKGSARSKQASQAATVPSAGPARPAPPRPATAQRQPAEASSSGSPPTAAPAPAELSEGAIDTYVQLTRTVERLHRRFLDVLRFELTRLGIADINAVQALMLTNLDGRDLAVRDLVERGYYLGSNVSYNLKQLVEAGYCEQERSERDKRSRRIVLTEKGMELCKRLAELDRRHARILFETAPDPGDPTITLRALRQLERSWSDYLRYQGR